jgi:hypothetical protein
MTSQLSQACLVVGSWMEWPVGRVGLDEHLHEATDARASRASRALRDTIASEKGSVREVSQCQGRQAYGGEGGGGGGDARRAV